MRSRGRMPKAAVVAESKVAPSVFDAQKALVLAMIHSANDRITSLIDGATVSAGIGNFDAVQIAMNNIKTIVVEISREAERFETANKVDVDIFDDDKPSSRIKKKRHIDDDDYDSNEDDE